MLEEKITQEFDVEAPITDTLWKDSTAIVATSNSGIKLIENGVVQSTLEGPAGNLRGVALHPSGDILAAVSENATCLFHDLTTGTKALQFSTDSGKFSLYSSNIFANVRVSLENGTIPSRRTPDRYWSIGWTDQDFRCEDGCECRQL